MAYGLLRIGWYRKVQLRIILFIFVGSDD